MRLTEFKGAAYLETNRHRILFGTFSEVHQRLQQAGLPFPDWIVCGDVRIQAGVPQLVPEFLFFGYLFLEHHFDFAQRKVKEPLTVVGTPEQCAAVRSIMDVSYLGASPHLLSDVPEMTEEIREMLVREGDYYALKDEAGRVIPIDAYFRFLSWQNEKLEEEGLSIEKLSGTRFRVKEEQEEFLIDLSFEGAQEPVWPLPEATDAQSPPFSLMVLGAAGPFQTESPSSSYLLTLAQERYLIDCAPYTARILERVGLAGEIKGIILTHVHDDHSGGLPAFLDQGVELLTTREIGRAARLKLAATLGETEESLERRISFREVQVERPLPLDGATLQFHYASHSVPTIGITVEVEGEKLTLTGDTAGHRTLREMLEEGVIPPERFDLLTGLSRKHKVLVDCGEALIHGYPQDFLHVPDTRNVILAHRKDLPPEYEGIFTLARSLQLFPLKDAFEVGEIEEVR